MPSHPLDVLYLFLICLQLVLLPLSPVPLIEGHQLVKSDLPILMGDVVGDVGEVNKGPDHWLVVVVRCPEGV